MLYRLPLVTLLTFVHYRSSHSWCQDHPAAAQGPGRAAAHQAADERLHDLGQGRAEEDLEDLPGHAQL